MTTRAKDLEPLGLENEYTWADIVGRLNALLAILQRLEAEDEVICASEANPSWEAERRARLAIDAVKAGVLRADDARAVVSCALWPESEKTT